MGAVTAVWAGAVGSMVVLCGCAACLQTPTARLHSLHHYPRPTYNGSNHEPGFLSYRRLPAYSLSLQLAVFSYLIFCRIIPSNCRCVLGISLRNCTMAVHECVLSCPSRPIGLAQMSRHQLQCPHGTGSLEMMPVTACSLLRHHKDPTSVYKKFPCCLLPSTCTAAQSLVQSTYNFDIQPCRRNLSCDLFLPYIPWLPQRPSSGPYKARMVSIRSSGMRRRLSHLLVTKKFSSSVCQARPQLMRC
jgi:hypothetical protein